MSLINRNKQYKVTIGMRRSWWMPIVSEPENGLPVYGDVEDMGAARLGTLTYTTSVVDIEGDDKVLRHIEVFRNGSFVGETTMNDLQINAKLYGHAFDAGVEHSNGDDQSPPGGYCFIEPILKTGSSKPIFRATFLLYLTANPANESQSAATRQGGNITPTYNSVTYTVYTCKTGDWRLRQEFATEAEAEAWLMGIAGATASWPVSVEIIGDGSVDPAGTTFFPAGEAAVLTFSAKPAVLYDGTTDKTSAVTNAGVYAIAAIAAPHRLVAVFAES